MHFSFLSTVVYTHNCRVAHVRSGTFYVPSLSLPWCPAFGALFCGNIHPKLIWQFFILIQSYSFTGERYQFRLQKPGVVSPTVMFSNLTIKDLPHFGIIFYLQIYITWQSLERFRLLFEWVSTSITAIVITGAIVLWLPTEHC